jgi:hypothetical protein
MKYIIIENKIVKQVQLDDKYKLSKTETMLETDKDAVCGQIYSKTTGEFTNPVIVKTKEEKVLELNQKTSKDIFTQYSENKQRNIAMNKDIDNGEFLAMQTFINDRLSLNKVSKGKL